MAFTLNDISLLCRLCAKQDTQIDIFGNDGSKYSVEKKIRLCLPIAVSEDDDMPKKICVSCLNKLDISYELYVGCVNAQTTIKKILNSAVNSAASTNLQSNSSSQVSITTKGGSLITLQQPSNVIKIGSSSIKLDDFVNERQDRETEVSHHLQNGPMRLQSSPLASNFSDLVKNSILMNDSSPATPTKPLQVTPDTKPSFYGLNNPDNQTIYFQNGMMLTANQQQQFISQQGGSMIQPLQPVSLTNVSQNSYTAPDYAQSGLVLQDLSSPQFTHGMAAANGTILHSTLGQSFQTAQYTQQLQLADVKPIIDDSGNCQSLQLQQQLQQQQLHQIQQQQQSLQFSSSSAVITNLNGQQMNSIYPVTSVQSKPQNTSQDANIDPLDPLSIDPILSSATVSTYNVESVQSLAVANTNDTTTSNKTPIMATKAAKRLENLEDDSPIANTSNVSATENIVPPAKKKKTLGRVRSPNRKETKSSPNPPAVKIESVKSNSSVKPSTSSQPKSVTVNSRRKRKENNITVAPADSTAPLEVELSDTEDDISMHSSLCTCPSCKPVKDAEVNEKECEFCHVFFNINVIDHHRNLHFRRSIYSCIDCGKNFCTETGLETHKCTGGNSP